MHAWRIALDCDEREVEAYRRLLSPDESGRASGLRFASHRRRFVVARGCLRSILALYLNAAPADIRFASNAYGKPHIDATWHPRQSLHFNISHSDELALVALSTVGDIGVDVERLRPDLSCEKIAAHYFSHAEAKQLERVAPHERTAAFFRCWTRKEAFIKAKGLGLSLPLDQFDVSFSSTGPARLLRTAWDASEAAQWTMHSISPGPGYAAALAVRGHGDRLRCWNWRQTVGVG